MNDSKNQRESCCICGKDVSNGWFAHIRRENEWVKLCSPACSIRYTDRDGLTANEPAPRFVVNGELC